MSVAIDHRSPAFLTVFDAAPCGLLLTDAAGIILNVNPAVCRMLGYTADALIGRGVWLLTSDSMDLVKRNIQQVLSGGRTQHEVINLTRDGESRSVMLRQTAVDLVDGRRGILVASLDITTNREVEFALAESESRHRRLFETSLDGIGYADLEGRILEANPALCRMLGYTASQLRGKHYSDLTPPNRHEQQSRAYQQVLAQGSIDQYETECRCADGQVLPIALAAWLETDDGGRPRRIFGVVRDMTERWRDREELRRREDELRRLNQRLGTLLREMDHRVKNNLANLYALVDLYARSADSVDALATAVRDKLSAMRWVHNMVASSGWQSLALNELMRRIAEQFDAPGHAERQLHIDGPAVRIPPRQIAALAMIFQELFANAFEHGTGGDIEITWRLLDNAPDARRIGITWQESGNEAIGAPISRGVGLNLIEGFARFELQGDCRWSFQPPGLRCEIECRLDEFDADVQAMLDLVFD